MTEKSRIENRDLIRAVIGFTLYLLFVPALLFIAAGTMKWPMAWAYTVLLLVSTIGSRLIVWKRSPDTLRERAKFTSSQGTKPWDRVLVAIVGILGPMAMMLVAGLDQRLEWSAVVPRIAQYLGILVIAAGYALAVWAMVVNPFFSAVARIQDDRGQVVVTTGPQNDAPSILCRSAGRLFGLAHHAGCALGIGPRLGYGRCLGHPHCAGGSDAER